MISERVRSEMIATSLQKWDTSRIVSLLPSEAEAISLEFTLWVKRSGSRCYTISHVFSNYYLIYKFTPKEWDQYKHLIANRNTN